MILATVAEPNRPDATELVPRAAAGDPEAQEHLVALLRRRVRTIAFAILGHPEDAEDTVQTTLMEILRSSATYRGGSLHAWADRIAVRTAVRHARQRRMRSAHLDASAEVESSAESARTNHPEHDIPRPILEYLSELPEARRTALVLRHVMDYSIEEIAQLQETSPNTIKDRLLQARRQLRRSIRRDLVCLPALDRSPR